MTDFDVASQVVVPEMVLVDTKDLKITKLKIVQKVSFAQMRMEITRL